MIPALGTCAFVLYLYLKLKSEEQTANATGVEASAGAVDATDSGALAARLASLQTRLERLARKQEKPS